MSAGPVFGQTYGAQGGYINQQQGYMMGAQLSHNPSYYSMPDTHQNPAFTHPQAPHQGFQQQKPITITSGASSPDQIRSQGNPFMNMGGFGQVQGAAGAPFAGLSLAQVPQSGLP